MERRANRLGDNKGGGGNREASNRTDRAYVCPRDSEEQVSKPSYNP